MTRKDKQKKKKKRAVICESVCRRSWLLGNAKVDGSGSIMCLKRYDESGTYGAVQAQSDLSKVRYWSHPEQKKTKM